MLSSTSLMFSTSQRNNGRERKSITKLSLCFCTCLLKIAVSFYTETEQEAFMSSLLGRLTTSSNIPKVLQLLTIGLLVFIAQNAHANKDSEKPMLETPSVVEMQTNKGLIKLQLFPKRAPTTVANFIAYAKKGFYDGTIFHRVIPNFMIQGGGFTPDLVRKATQAPIKNEANAFLPNIRGSISMARTSAPHSATSQFFINTVNNRSLNKSSSNAGYAVFGKVIEGMQVVDSISSMRTANKNGMGNVPVDTIIIEKVSVQP